MKLTKAEIDEAERVLIAIMEECKLRSIDISYTPNIAFDPNESTGMRQGESLNDLYRQAMNEQAAESPL